MPSEAALLWPAAVASLNNRPISVELKAPPPPMSVTITRPASTLGNDPYTEPVAPVATLRPAKRPASRPAGEGLSPARKRTAHSSNPVNTPPNQYSLRQDRLGTLVSDLARQLTSCPSWEVFVERFRGRSYLADELDQLDHPAAPLLRQWRDHGVPALSSSPPWPSHVKDSYVARGCHRSAAENSDFLREEMSEFIDNRFWVVLPYALVRDMPQLQLSPAAVKEERERKPRLLCDHSWYPVNDDTLPHAPPEAMQFGGALARIMRDVRHADPAHGPVYLSKYDIKDGYYRMFLAASDCPRLAIVLPLYEGEEQLVAIPMSTTMGWVQSPPTFCAMSETIADITNAKANAFPLEAPPHRLEAQAAMADDIHSTHTLSPREAEDETASVALSKLFPTVEPARSSENLEPGRPSNCPLSAPVNSTDVFVDDFIQAGQGEAKRLGVLRRHLLHSIDEVLAQPMPDDKRNEAVSLKKLLKGDGGWNTRKLILGWIIDTARQTLELPAHRKQQLHDIFSSLQGLRRVSFKTWRRILGKLRFVSLAIPGSRGLFSALQWAQNQANGNRVRLNKFVRSNLDAFGRLAASLCTRPTHLAELVPENPSLLGATDAAKAGMGGVFFDTSSGRGYFWRAPFPDDIGANLASVQNPTGPITNSDLEQAAWLGQLDVMACNFPVCHATLANVSDNIATVSRAKKGAVATPGAASYLCQLSSDHQREHRYCPLTAYIPGPANVMADDCSRLVHLTNDAFRTHMNQSYPQAEPWTQLALRPEMLSTLNSALRLTPQKLPLCPRPAPLSRASGPTGSPSVAPTATPPTSPTSLTKKPSSVTSSCSPPDAATPGPAAAANLSGLRQFQPRSNTWERGSPSWVTPIPASRLLESPSSIPYSMIISRPWNAKTTLKAERTPPTSPLCATSPPFSLQLHTLNMSPCSALSASTGSSAPPSTSPAKAKAAPKPSSSATPPSRSTAKSTTPLTPL